MLYDIEQLVRVMKILKPLPTRYQQNLHPCVLAMITYAPQIMNWIDDPVIYLKSIHAYVFDEVERNPEFFNSVDFKIFNNYYQGSSSIHFEGIERYEAIDEVYQSWFRAKCKQLRNNTN